MGGVEEQVLASEGAVRELEVYPLLNPQVVGNVSSAESEVHAAPGAFHGPLVAAFLDPTRLTFS